MSEQLTIFPEKKVESKSADIKIVCREVLVSSIVEALLLDGDFKVNSNLQENVNLCLCLRNRIYNEVDSWSNEKLLKFITTGEEDVEIK